MENESEEAEALEKLKKQSEKIELASMTFGAASTAATIGAAVVAPKGLVALAVGAGLMAPPFLVAVAPIVAIGSAAVGGLSAALYFYIKWRRRKLNKGLQIDV